LTRARAAGHDRRVTGRARLGLAVGVLLALAAAPSATAATGLLAGAPAVGGVAVQAPGTGALAGRVVLDVAVAHPEVAARAAGRVHLARATHHGLVRLRLRAADGTALASAGSREPLLGRSTLIALRCMGDAPRVSLADGPQRGAVSVVGSAPGATLVRYRAPAAPGVSDRLVLRAVNAAGATVVPVAVTTRPFTMRAIGDSVTAGFGYLGDGTAMGGLQLPFCIPPDALNDRCSSNSSNGPSSGGPPAWSSDFGYGNQVAWSAQFAKANGIAGAAFENRAVSGSTPADWNAGGQLSDTLGGVVADDPDLTVMTLGANPLLDLLLAGRGIGCAATLSDPAFRVCIQNLVDQQQLVARLRSVIAGLLVAPGNRVVVSQYHLSIPASSLFSVSSLRIIAEVVNANVAAAVQGAPGFGSRVFLMTPPPFPVGLPPGDVSCPGTIFTSVVDGRSRQSRVAQDELVVTNPRSFCGSTEYWIISADTGIHPSVAGHAQYAAGLQALVDQNDLGPPGP
jgi:lysophospholipase L1-like esterase